MPRWRLGIIGCGWAGEQHANAVRAMPQRAHISAIADVNRDAVEGRADDWKIPEWSTDYHELLTKELLDGVIICLPHSLHAAAAIEAAGAGLHVLIEKPLATTLAEADEMIAAADAAKVQLMVAENVCFDPTTILVADLVHEGKLGDLILVRISREHQMHEYLRQRPWFLAEPSGGILYSGGIHDFELLRILAGEIDHVYALTGHKVLPEMTADDSSVVLAKMRNGAAAVLVESFSLRTASPGVHGTVHGSQGSLWFYREQIRLYSASEDGHAELVDEIEVVARNTFEAELEHFLDCLESGQKPRTDGAEERKPLVAVLAAYESVRRGERVYLSDFDDGIHLTSPA